MENLLALLKRQRNFMLNDFRLNDYKALCKKVVSLDRPIITFKEYFSNPDEYLDKPFIILRHDVDRKPLNALKIALVEKELGIKSTYYFRFIPSVFKEEIINKISILGHEIGYHYETMAKAKGSIPKALEIFQYELEQFRKISEITTICMHGSPLSPYDNRDLWKFSDFKKFGIKGEPYLSIDYTQILYFTDTGRTWGDSNANLRDVVSTNLNNPIISSTLDLIDSLETINKSFT